MGFTLAIWLGCEDTSFPFTYLLTPILYIFLYYLSILFRIWLFTHLFFLLYQQAERNFSLRLFRFLKVIIQPLTLNIRKIVTHTTIVPITARTAVVTPRLLSETFLKPLRAWDYPNKLPFVPKRRCLLV